MRLSLYLPRLVFQWCLLGNLILVSSLSPPIIVSILITLLHMEYSILAGTEPLLYYVVILPMTEENGQNLPHPTPPPKKKF
jgi:hypothetical protein